jgi:acetolactate synthase-1/2/3 large subunit
VKFLSKRQVVDARNIATLVRDAFRIAQSERPGSVHLELPEDIAAQETDSVELVPASSSFRPVATGDAIREAARKIAKASFPLIVLGSCANRPGMARTLSAAMHRMGIPFFNTQMGNGAVNGNSDPYLATAALSSGDYVHLASDHADLIIAVGHGTVEKPPFIMSPDGPEMIQIDFNPAEIDQIYYPHLEVIGDIGQHDAHCSVYGGIATRFSYYQKIQALILERVGEGADDMRYPPSPQRIVANVRSVMPDDGILCLDNGMYKISFARNYRTHVSNIIFLDNALATMELACPMHFRHPSSHARSIQPCAPQSSSMPHNNDQRPLRIPNRLDALCRTKTVGIRHRWHPPHHARYAPGQSDRAKAACLKS